MKKSIRTLTLKQAKAELDPAKPLLVFPICIKIGRHKVSIYGYDKARDRHMEYTVKRAISEPKRIYTSDWARVVDEVLHEADIIDNPSPVEAPIMLRGVEKFRYEQLLAAIAEAEQTGGVLKILQAINFMVEKTPESFKRLMETVSLAGDSGAVLSGAIQAGVEFERFASRRPYLAEHADFLRILGSVLPACDTLPSNDELIEKFLEHNGPAQSADTQRDYRSKLRAFSHYLAGKPFLLVRSEDVFGFIVDRKLAYKNRQSIMSPGTQAQYRSKLHTFMDYLKHTNNYPAFLDNPVVIKFLVEGHDRARS